MDWKTPEDLQRDFDFKLGDHGVTHAKLLEIMNQVIASSVKPGHPYFINQLYSRYLELVIVDRLIIISEFFSLDPYGLAAQWVTDSLNPSAYTFEVAPVFTLMEMEV